MPQDEKEEKEVEAKAPEAEVPAKVPAKAPAKAPAEKKPPKTPKAKRRPRRPKGAGRKAAPKAKGRRGRPKSAVKAARDAFASGIRRFGAIAKAVFQATGQKIRFPAIAKALAGLRKKAAPKAKGRRGRGRPRGARRGRKPGRPKGAARAGVSFLIEMPGRGKGVVKAGSLAQARTVLSAYVAKGGDPTRAAVYAQRPVRITRTISVRL